MGHNPGFHKSMREEVAFELKQIRKQRNLSQEDLAEKMGVSRTTLSKIENGKFSITIDYLEKFAVHLGFELRFIIKEDSK